MNAYLALFFPASSNSPGVLKKWLLKQGQEIRQGETLFQYQIEDHEKAFSSPVSGTLKVFLGQAGDSLRPGAEVVILEVSSEEAEKCARNGLGKILQPEELKELAEAGSIRLPPEE